MPQMRLSLARLMGKCKIPLRGVREINAQPVNQYVSQNVTKRGCRVGVLPDCVWAADVLKP